MTQVKDSWFVSRPKRDLRCIPQILSCFSSVAVGKPWARNQEMHIALEEQLEHESLKRVGERRDARGSGGRTYASLLQSLGLWFEFDNKVRLTLAGQAIISGKPYIEVLKKQVMNFQYPNPSIATTPRFKIRPFRFMFRLLMDDRIRKLDQTQIASILMWHADNESNECYNHIVELIEQKRAGRVYGVIPNDADSANTMMNWLNITGLVIRHYVEQTVEIDPDKRAQVDAILGCDSGLIPPCEKSVFLRKYGVDPWHKKDTRNMLDTSSITPRLLNESRVKNAFLRFAESFPVPRINEKVCSNIARLTGLSVDYVAQVLTTTYPHGAFEGFSLKYREMAFAGQQQATGFELATASIFTEILGVQSYHLGQLGAKSCPDVLVDFNEQTATGIIDTKAYSKYSITGDHRNRMIHNYIDGFRMYANKSFFNPGCFSYIAGGFISTISDQVQQIAQATGVGGSAMSVNTVIEMMRRHQQRPYTQHELLTIMSLNRLVTLEDIR